MNYLKTSFSLFAVLCSSYSFGQTNLKPSDTEYYKPTPPEVHIKNNIPSDALILFDGKNLTQWESDKKPNEKAAWTIINGVLEVKPGSGNIRTKEIFDNFQLHIEWKSPSKIKGDGQGRGNSGIFLQGLYEIQVLDNDNNPTYVNGQAGSLYKQRPPLADVKVADQWHSYDIIYKAPQFNKDSLLISKGTVTVLHNGVLIQNNTQIDGTTEYIGLPKNTPHAEGPIILQDHGDLVQFRNIWLRKL